MKRLLHKIWKLVVLCLATALAAMVVATYYGSELLLAPVQGTASSASLDEYAWALGQYQAQLDRLEVQAVRYATKLDPDRAKLRKERELLEGAYRMLQLSRGPDSSGQGTLARDSVASLDRFMGLVRSDTERVEYDPAHIGVLGMHCDEVRQALGNYLTAARYADVQRLRTDQADFLDRREGLLISWMVLWAAILLALVGFLFDVRRTRTALRMSRESLRQQEKTIALLQEEVFAKTTILGTISHELKIPLQTIISSVDLLANRIKAPREVEVIERLNSGASRLQAQMQDLTDYARLDSGRMGLRRIEFVPHELVKRVLTDLKDAAERKGLQLVQHGGRSNAVVATDAHRIQQILTNLVTNAIKYSSKGAIQVSAELKLDKEQRSAPWLLELSVADSGPGIAQADLPYVFEPFTQIEQDGTRRLDGAGLGLAIVKKLVDLFEGTIAVQSELGRGSRFTVSLPVSLVTEAKGAQEESALPR
ncbi:sensor histidine kinase [Pseudoduganella chitinolytica]|uniref:histidine kinase n=1 Tax=Pseudoduganella chitinolytica TaxID=34070 RepID=A0ABY8B6K0_9BURK|nr:HAMP domain-containing sensor histidine kinase [Pseudoduganella chitinolytica]WEF31559.1 HAMP domain-containing sensor histidine kinase [Pseudoduganella chitinolytica]